MRCWDRFWVWELVIGVMTSMRLVFDSSLNGLEDNILFVWITLILIDNFWVPRNHLKLLIECTVDFLGLILRLFGPQISEELYLLIAIIEGCRSCSIFVTSLFSVATLILFLFFLLHLVLMYPIILAIKKHIWIKVVKVVDPNKK